MGVGRILLALALLAGTTVSSSPGFNHERIMGRWGHAPIANQVMILRGGMDGEGGGKGGGGGEGAGGEDKGDDGGGQEEKEAAHFRKSTRGKKRKKDSLWFVSFQPHAQRCSCAWLNHGRSHLTC
jgi:hypothetical protein